MNDSKSDTIQHEQVSPPLVATDPVPAAPNRSRNKMIFIVGALIAGLFLCVVLCVVVVGTGTIKVMSERDDVEQVIDEFMHAMDRRDTDAAYELLSTRAKRTASHSDLEELLQGNNFALFNGYKNVGMNNINLNTVFQTNPNLPQGTVAKVNGTITYEGGHTGRFDAVLEQENEVWRLFSINITVPPDKIESD